MRDAQGNKVMVTPSVLYNDEVAIAGVDGGENGFTHIRFDGYDWHDGDRAVYTWKVFDVNASLIGEGADIYGGVGQKPNALKAMGSLISFLTACAESKTEDSDNYHLFERDVREWAEGVSDELSIIALEIEGELE